MEESNEQFFTVRCSCQHCALKMSYKKYVGKPDQVITCEHCGGIQVSKNKITGAPTFIYNRSGGLKKTNSFTDRLREIQKNVPSGAKDSIGEHIY